MLHYFTDEVTTSAAARHNGRVVAGKHEARRMPLVAAQLVMEYSTQDWWQAPQEIARSLSSSLS